MKKRIVLLLITCALSFNLVACGNGNINAESQKTAANSEESLDDLGPSGEFEVDEGLFNVKLTIPADFIGETTQEELDEVCKEEGLKSIILNDDGSATYTMTKKQHKALLEELRENINTTLDEMPGSEDYPNITRIEANDNFTEFKVTTKNTELDFAETFSIITFYFCGGMYNAYSGDEIEDISVTFVNSDSGEIIDTFNSSDIEQ